jgi:pimeloyl-ACP methyl ester carboxylesterase
MRIKYVALFFIGTLAWSVLPSAIQAAPSRSIIYKTEFVGLMPIPYTLSTPQTALRVGNTPTFQVRVHSPYGYPPTVSVDLSQLSVPSPTTTPAGLGSPNYNSDSYYNFGPFTIGADIPDGLKTISITATDSVGGDVATATARIIVDNIKPTILLSSITFSTTSPKQGDYMYLSGKIDGTGSVAKAAYLTMYLFDAAGNPAVSNILGGSAFTYNAKELNVALSTSTDGSFSNVPIQLIEFSDIGWIARAAKLSLEPLVYDEAGNFGTTTLMVPIPKTPPPDPCASGGCVSNVLFLPGIEGSRLYEGVGCGKTAEEKLWEPLADSLLQILRGAGNDKVRDLFLDQSGASACSDIYAKSDDVIDVVRGNNIYASLIREMNGIEADGTINDWKPVAYDWRLSLLDLLNKGTERNGKIYYEEATSTPYIEQTLRALAGSSQTGKVTIVAHSNGGLVAKALLNKLGDVEAAALVDKVLMVGAPQSGAPEALGVALVGHNAGIYKYGFPIVSNAVVQEFARNSPMTYHLLPSEDYLESTAGDSEHPVARFAGDGYAGEISAYGAAINSRAELTDFLLAETLNASLIDYANSQHATLDSWTPPAGIEVSQIAGWGIDTLSGIDFYTPPPINALTALEPMRAYRPIFIEDGDGVVPVPSALMMASGTNVKKYWLNLDSYFRATSTKRSHKDIFEIPSLKDLIINIIRNGTSTLPAYISTSQPSPITENKKLTFFLHSPLTLQLTDSSGHITGLAEDDSMTQDIPDSVYGEFGEVKYIIVPEGNYTLSMSGQASGTFSLDMQESSGGIITASSTIANVPTTANTLASLTISGGLSTASALMVDQNGDGTDVLTITPQIGETVTYEPPVPVSVASSGGSGGGGASFSSPVPVVVATTTDILATTTSVIEPVATSTLEISTSTNLVQTKKKMFVPTVPKSQEVAASPRKVNPNTQTASVYNASQQSISTQLGRVVYNSLHRLWRGLKVIFSIQK